MREKNELDAFYTDLFTKDPLWSTPYPNYDESARWAKISEFLCRIHEHRNPGSGQTVRILDVGCGRGWLARQASVFGRCDGIDPVYSSIELARKYYPDVTFYHAHLAEFLKSPTFSPYDAVITSEVIEHVVDKDGFVNDIADCLLPMGHVLLTTPRGKKFKQWLRLGYERQPVEAWVSEKALRQLFERHNFIPMKHERVYLDLPRMSLLHRLCASAKFSRLLGMLGMMWIYKGLQFAAGFYQVWWFQLKKD